MDGGQVDKKEIDMKKAKMVWADEGVIWVCRTCGAYNLETLNWEDFVCIYCGVVIHALAERQYIKSPTWLPPPRRGTGGRDE